MAENHVRESQRRERTRRRPITDSDAHLSATTAQRARVSHGRDLLLSSWSSSGVTAPEAADPLNCYATTHLGSTGRLPGKKPLLRECPLLSLAPSVSTGPLVESSLPPSTF